ncbi:MAG: cupin domain-containing protein [Bacteroidetes bacterium]|nr:cupin domain-containing protein [Bacteroidota bacterium]
MTVEFLVNRFNLLPHPEGGFYKETYRNENKELFTNFNGKRNLSTAIYFLIEQNNFSAFHKIKSDEMWHFYYGDALEVIEINEIGELKHTVIGNQIQKGETFQYNVKANTWFASRVYKNGTFSFVGCTVAPGFDFLDFELASASDLILNYPQHKQVIMQLTR